MKHTLELKRKELDLIRLQSAKAEIEFNIEEKIADIERLEAHILLNKEKQEEIKQEIERIKSNG